MAAYIMCPEDDKLDLLVIHMLRSGEHMHTHLTHVRSYRQTHHPSIHCSAYPHLHIQYTCTCTHACALAHTHTNTHCDTHTHTRTHTHTHTYTHTHTRTHTHIHTHVHTHTHTHTHVPERAILYITQNRTKLYCH